MHRYLLRTILFVVLAATCLGLAQSAASQDAAPEVSPVITIVSPTSGQVIDTAHVEVNFSVSNFLIGPWDFPHVAFFLDDNPKPFTFYNGSDNAAFGNRTVFSGFAPTAAATWINYTTLRFNNLSNGAHTVTANLTDAQGNLLQNPNAIFTVTFTVDQSPDNVALPNGLVFVKEQFNPPVPPPNAAPGMGRVFNNNPPAVGDLYLLTPVSANGTLYQLTDVADSGGGVVDPEVSYDGERVLFSMRQSTLDSWHIWEMNLDGSNLHQITFDPPHLVVNDQDPEYLPDGRIIFASDRLKQRETKPYDQAITTQLYIVHADGSNLHQVDYNANFDINPQVARDGRILFDRWDHLHFMRNMFSLWRMNQDGTNGFVNYGGVSPRFDQQGGENANALESRELSTGEMVGIFTNRESLAGKMGIFDTRSPSQENLPFPLMIGPDGLYRTPYPLTDSKLIYGYTPSTDPLHNGFGLYTMQLTPEYVLVDDTTVSTAPGPDVDPAFRTYNINLANAGRIYLEVSGVAEDNGANPPDRAWVSVDGIVYDGGSQDIERKLDGSLTFGAPYSYRVDIDLPAGQHTINIATDATPTITHVRIVRAITATNHTVLYDDPNTNEVSPIPVRVRNLPPAYTSHTNPSLNWGTIVVRDISLRGDYRQANYEDAGGDPDYPYHMDLNQIQGLRIKQSLPRHNEMEDMLVGSTFFDPVRVVGVATANETGTTAFQVLAGTTVAWDLIDLNGAAMAHERVWSWVQPGESRSCDGCHVGAFPYVERPIDVIPPAQDLRQRGEIYSFVDQVLPIFQQKCAACHTGGNPDGNLNLQGNRATFEALTILVPERTPTQYVSNGDARFSFLFQLLTGDTDTNPLFAPRLQEVNNSYDHTTLLNGSELYEVATWIDVGAGFAYLPRGVAMGPPRVVSVLPANGATNIKRNTGVAVHFSAPIDRATVDSSSFVLQKIGGDTVSGTWEWNNNDDLFFRPDSNLSTGDYQLTISTAVQDIKEFTTGLELAAPFVSSFTVAYGTDETPPETAELLPGGDSINAFAPVTVRFTEAIAPSSITDNSLTVTDGNGFFVDGRVYVSADGLELNWFPWTAFTTGETYEVSLRNEIHDLAGNSLTPLNYSFTIATASTPQHHSQLAALPTNHDPKRMAVNHAGTELLLATDYDNIITRYDIATWQVLDNYDIGPGTDPRDVVYAPDDQTAYVLNPGNKTLKFLDINDGVVQSVSGFLNPDRLLVNHAGTRLYVSDIGGAGYIHEVDIVVGSPTYGTIINSFNLGRTPSPPAISPDDTTLYYGSSFAFNIFDIASGSNVKSIYIPYGTVGEVVLTPDGRAALAPSTSNQSLRYIDLIIGQDRGDILLPDDPDHLALNPAGTFLYLVNRGTQAISVMDMATLQVVATMPTPIINGTFVQDLEVSPNNNTIFAVAGGIATELTVYALGDPNDHTPPTRTGVVPPANAIDIPVYAPIRASFSEALDRISVNNSTVWLEANDTAIDGNLALSLDNRTASFAPGTLMQTGTLHTLHLDQSLADLAGNPLGVDQDTTFVTAATHDPGTLSQLDTPFSSNGSRGLAISPDGSLLAVSNRFQNSISLLDPQTMQPVMDSIATGSSGPRGLAFNSDGSRLYVVHNSGNTLVEIDVAGGQVLRTIANVAGNEEVVISPDGLTAYTSGYNSHIFNEIDLTTGQVTTPLGLVSRAGRPAYAPNGTLYLTTNDTLWRQNSDGTWTAIPTGSSYTIDVGFSADSHYAFLAETWRDALMVVDLTTDTVLLEIPLDDEPRQIAQSADYRYLFVTNKSAGTIQVVDTLTLAIVEEATLADSQMMAAAWDSTHARLFVSDVNTNQIIGFEIDYVAPPPNIYDDSSYNIQYGDWYGGNDANAYGGGYRASQTANEWLVYKTGVTNAFSLLTYRGPNQGKAYVMVDGAVVGALDLYAAAPAYETETFSDLSMAQHTIVIIAAGQKNPSSSGYEARVDGFVVNGQTIDDSSLSVIVKGWSGLSAPWASNGGLRMSTSPGSTATFVVNGDSFTWTTVHCPMCGKAKISVDGVDVSTRDLYNAAWQVQQQEAFTGLGPGSHTVTITILSSKNPASSGTLVIVDSITY
ncbi:MAG: Ig-like domain-containing protein [Ardenticatenales bacterium]|nr:Ig-like domain-containing protein [Ardenticatenales bacterium]